MKTFYKKNTFWKLIISSVFFIMIVFLARSFFVKNTQTESAFYYWKSNLIFKEADIKFLKQMNVEKIYAKFFDIIWNSDTGKPEIMDKINIHKNSVRDLEIIPVVFITYETLHNLNTDKFENFADSVITSMNYIIENHNLRIKEFQIDCHWTASTKEKYFNLLQVIKMKIKQKYPETILSATIELHQIKFSDKTGVPPADKGVLLVYHTEYVDFFDSQNSILNNRLAKKYLKDLDKYPLEIDIALPIFSWLVHFDYNKNMVRIINNFAEDDIKNNSDLEKVKKNLYKAVNDTFIDDKRIMKHDFIKIEGSGFDQCREMARYIKRKITKNSLSIILFYYDENNIERFTNGNPQKLFSIFNPF